MRLLNSWRWRYAFTVTVTAAALVIGANAGVKTGVMAFSIGTAIVWSLAVREQVTVVAAALRSNRPDLWDRLNASLAFRHLSNLSPVFLQMIFSGNPARDPNVGAAVRACRRVHIEALVLIGLMLAAINIVKNMYG